MVYVNGTEVFRDTSVRSSASLDTLLRTPSLDNGLAAFRIDDAIESGQNTIAVELHQSRNDTDLRFDLRLTATQVPEPSDSGAIILACLLFYGRRRKWLLGSTR